MDERPDALWVSPPPYGTADDWWSVAYDTEGLTTAVLEQVTLIRRALGIISFEFTSFGDADLALRQSALHYLEDAQAAIDAYRAKVERQRVYWVDSMGDPSVLLEIYGLLQAFILQQDAARILWRSVEGPRRDWWSDFPDLKYIREIRNAAAGHPCDLRDGLGMSYQVVHRDRLSLRNFDMSQSGGSHCGYGAVKPDCLIVEQSLSMARLLSDLHHVVVGGVTDSAVGWHRPWM